MGNAPGAVTADGPNDPTLTGSASDAGTENTTADAAAATPKSLRDSMAAVTRDVKTVWSIGRVGVGWALKETEDCNI